ncbi:PQQ-dependent sugar dehydrogenase [Maribacter ulvicola]|uniref:Por secretion system C-terminal sorting domain-containing protein n=1 Tax=Maribacter ulvicola TaxID=228959 RepID=A0A1N6VL06_9FLAO|nr:PQQ-dependent sugar dehydrogenase [Maribacter ulvicola]SIQ78479.1 Por secretion system C-terminal sorting domain-containing protein [Maribacter ulvicola]
MFPTKPINFFLFLTLQLTFSSILCQTSYKEAFPNLSFNFPVEIQNSADNSDRIFVVEQPGLIKVFPNKENVTVQEQKTFLDISSTVAYSSGQEIGLLGLAFHPNYESNGYIFIYYIDKPSTYRINLARYKVDSSNPNLIDSSSKTIIAQFTKNQSDSNHNGGKIAFGPDGYLYISVGDGGGGGDPKGNGQNLNTVFGSLLRIDVDLDGNNPLETNPELPNGKYEIPSDNPRVGQTGLDELYAWGIRNTWKFSFDPTGTLWGSDVGQNSYEEINIITKGGNYGWNKFEANTEPSYGNGTSLSTTPDIKPIFFYDHSASDVSITGGYTYRGSLTNNSLKNKYIYGDYVSGRVWALEYDATNGSTSNELLFKTNGAFISSFGEDEDGELYFSDYGSNAKLFKLTETISGPVATPVDGIGEWKPLASGTNGIVEAIATSTSGESYIAGSFSTAGGISVSALATLSTTNEWGFLGSDIEGSILTTAVAPDGTLYIGGEFTAIAGIQANNIAKWNGSAWSALSSGTNGPITTMQVNENGALFIGGIFTTAGGLNANNIAKWENNSWNLLTDSATNISGTNNDVRSIHIDEDKVYIGGNFDTAGGIATARIARWDGSNWSALGTGTSGYVQAINSAGEYLYVGGNFALAGDKTVNRIARYHKKNNTWEALGTGVSGNVNAITSAGSYIYVGGTFDTASDNGTIDKIVKNIARWSSQEGWEALGSGTNVGVNTRVNTLQFIKNGTELLVGGNFSSAGNISANNIAVWGAVLCTDESVVPHYAINGTWESGNSDLTITEGDDITLSVLPNNISFTITLPDGSIVANDYVIENIDSSKSGTYIFTTSEGCTNTLSLTVSTTANDEDDDNDGILNVNDICPNTVNGATVNENGCSSDQLNNKEDDDNDGVINANDNCPNTANGATVDENGCSSDQLKNNGDNDNDGVLNENDDCPNTANGATVDENGCSITSYPANQFKITSTGASCINSANGSILIESITNEEFTATINGVDSNSTIVFSETLSITNLEKGTYTLCLTSIGEKYYQSCSTIVITEPLPLNVLLDLDPETNSVNLKMSGAEEYTIQVNAKSFKTKKELINIPLLDETNTISVSTNQLCQGTYEEIIYLKNTPIIYPNPVGNHLSIDLKSLTIDKLEIAIFTESGLLVHSDNYKVEQSIIEINTSLLSSGVYFLRLKGDSLNKSFKLLKQ